MSDKVPDGFDTKTQVRDTLEALEMEKTSVARGKKDRIAEIDKQIKDLRALIGETPSGRKAAAAKDD